MTVTARDFFRELGRRGHEPLLHGVTGTLRFDLAHGDKTERWLVSIRKGEVSVSQRAGKADCIVRSDRALFDRIASGEANAMTAMLRGLVDFEGDPQPLLLFQRLFPGPQGPAAGRHELDDAGGRP